MIISFVRNTIKTSSILCTLTPIRNISTSIKTKVIIIRARRKKKKWEETVWEEGWQNVYITQLKTNVTPYW